MTIEFFVPGVCRPAGSKRAFYVKAIGRAVVTDACEKTKPWQADVKQHAADAMKGAAPVACPVKLTVEFNMTRPKSHFGTRGGTPYLRPGAPTYHASKPDTTKCLRAIEDAMTGVVWRDDAQVVIQAAEKRYSDRPGARIKVTTLGAMHQEEPQP